MKIENAGPDSFERVRSFYHSLIDELKENPMARAIYEACRFRYVSTVRLYYENTGWTEFELLEVPLV